MAYIPDKWDLHEDVMFQWRLWAIMPFCLVIMAMCKNQLELLLLLFFFFLVWNIKYRMELQKFMWDQMLLKWYSFWVFWTFYQALLPWEILQKIINGERGRERERAYDVVKWFDGWWIIWNEYVGSIWPAWTNLSKLWWN